MGLSRLSGPLSKEGIWGEGGSEVSKGGARASGFSLPRLRRGTGRDSGVRARGEGRVLRPGGAWAGGARTPLPAGGGGPREGRG